MSRDATLAKIEMRMHEKCSIMGIQGTCHFRKGRFVRYEFGYCDTETSYGNSKLALADFMLQHQ